MSDTPRGKSRNQDMIDTRPLRPVDPHTHRAHLELRVDVHTGVVDFLLVCDDCPQRAMISQHLVPNFHAPGTAKPEGEPP